MLVFLSQLQIVRPELVESQGGWTDQDGGNAIAAAIDEAVPNDADYGKSSQGPVDDVLRMKLQPFAATSLHQVGRLRYRIGRQGASAVQQTLRLYQGGAAVIGAGTLVGGPWVHSVGPATTFEQTVDPTLVTNADNLYFEIEAN